MGNSISASSNSVQIFLDHYAYRPGQTVSGSICINVNDVTAHFGGLYIEVTGMEQTRFTNDRSDGDNETRECYGSNEVFRARVPFNLMDQNLKASPGQYQYPFTFQLPQHLPPSLQFNSGDISAKLHYKVSVIVRQNPSAVNWTGRLAASTPLKVLSTTPPPPTPTRSPRRDLERYAEGPVSDCCGCCLVCAPCCTCCMRGTVSTHVGADTDTITTGGSAGTYALVFNGTSVPVHCTLRLTRHLRVADNYGAYRERHDHLWTHSEGPIFPNYSDMHRMASRAFVPTGGDAAETPSATSELIQCRYELQSVVRPHNGCCGTRVTAALPVDVASTDVQAPGFSDPPMPVGWQPTVLGTQDLGMPAPSPPSHGMRALPSQGGVREPLLPPSSQDMSYQITDQALV